MNAETLCEGLARRYQGIQDREDIYQELMLRVVELGDQSDEFIRTAIRNRMRDLCRLEATRRMFLRTVDVLLHMAHVPARLESAAQLASFHEHLSSFIASLNALEQLIVREMTSPSSRTLRNARAHRGPEVKVRSCCVAKAVNASPAAVSRVISGVRVKAAEAFGFGVPSAGRPS